LINVLGIGLDYLMLKDDNVRGDVRERQFDYAKHLKSLTLIVYSPAELKLGPEKWTENLYIYPTNSKNKATFILDALKIASKICRGQIIDMITTEDPFTTGLIGYILKRKFKVPLNVQVHVDFCDNPYWMSLRKINRKFNILGKYTLKRADTIRVGTNKEKRNIINLGIKEDRIFVIPVNSDLNKFANADGRSIRNIYMNGRFNNLLLYTGRLVQQKDVTTLLNALKLVLARKPSTLLLVVGSGPEEKDLKDLSVELGINNNVIFTGSVPHDAIPQYLAACDVYTISSIFEGTCIAMVEAMAAGKPVVATKFAGAEDLIVDGKNGFVVNQKDYKAMAEDILHILDYPDEYKNIKIYNHERLDKIFGKEGNIEDLIGLWNLTAELCSKKKHEQNKAIRVSKPRIVTTYRITDCDLWERNATPINYSSRSRAIKNSILKEMVRISEDMALFFKYFSIRNKYDVLLTNSDRVSNIFAIFQALFGKRIHHVMLNCLWPNPQYLNKISWYFRKKIWKFISKGVDKYIVFASHEIEDYSTIYSLPKDKFIYIPFYFTPSSLKYNASDEGYMFSGGHPHYRDYSTLFNAVKNLNIKCKLAVQIPEYFSNVNVPDNVEISYLSEEDYFLCMAKSKVVVVPLKKEFLRSAGQRSYLDAMLMGKPVIVCDKKGAYDYIVNGEEGIIVPPGNPAALRQSIELVLKSDGQATKMGQRAKEKAKMFTIENTMRQVLDLLEEIAGKQL